MSSPTHMKALLLTKYNQKYELKRDVPIPKPGDGEVLVRISASSFCHTDYQVYQGVYKTSLPIIPSHEPAGTIIELGPNVPDRWKVGQKVGVINFRNPCGKCSGCRWHCSYDKKLDARYCENKTMSGILKADGGFAEYMVAASYAIALLPNRLEFEQAAPLMCAGATVWNALRQAGVKLGGSVAIIGVGGLGVLGLQFAKVMGYKTVAVDSSPKGLKLAADVSDSLKPDLIVNIDDDDSSDQIAHVTEGIGLDAVVVCTDNVRAADWSITILRPRGTCVVLGLPDEGYKFDAFALVFREIVVRGSLHSSVAEIEEMMREVEKHNIRSHVTIVPLDDAESLPDMIAEKRFTGRLVVQM